MARGNAVRILPWTNLWQVCQRIIVLLFQLTTTGDENIQLGRLGNTKRSL